jgi:dihydrofolate synthase/folylpolyglutamate synthase
MAFQHFADEEVEYAVVEVGMGGRLDATNVFSSPLVTVITNIGLEHVQQLGATEEAIAREKAGIMRKGVPVVTGAEGLALKAVWSEAAKCRAPLKVLRSLGRPEVVKSDLDSVQFTLPNKEMGKLTTKMPGEHQATNAAIAVHAVDLMLESDGGVGKSAIQKGVAKAFLPARLQVLQKNPAFIVDGAHNPDATKTLRGFLQKCDFEHLFVLYGVLKDKDFGQMTQTIAPMAQEVFVTQPPNSGDRGLNAKALAGEAKRYCSRVRTVHSLPTALKTLVGAAGPKDGIVCFGSFYLAGAVLDAWEELEG